MITGRSQPETTSVKVLVHLTKELILSSLNFGLALQQQDLQYFKTYHIKDLR